MSPTSVSIVAIGRDGAEDVQRLVRSVQDQVVDVPVEVVVVDDGSAAPLADALGGLDGPAEVSVIRIDGEGNRSAARNLGAEAAQGELLVLLDSDQELPPGYLQDQIRWHAAVPDLFLNGHRRHRAEGAGWRPEVRERVTSVYSDNYARIAAGWYLQFSCNLSLATAAYRKLGGFDGDYRGWGLEDSDFGYRAQRDGLTIAHSTAAWTWDHHHVVRFDPARVEEWERNRRLFLSKYPEPEAQAVRLIDNYPSRPDLPSGPAWLESFLSMDQEVRSIHGLEPLAAPGVTVTVLNDADAAYARTLLSGRGDVRVVDGLAGSGLDIAVQLAGDRAEYHSLLHQGVPCSSS